MSSLTTEQHREISRQIRLAVRSQAALPHPSGCHGVVTRDGVQDACQKPATCLIDDPEGGYWPACVWHAHQYGSGRMVTLAAIAQAIEGGS